jgi:hypothetical protein
MQVTNSLEGRRVRRKGAPKDEWIYVIGVTSRHPDLFVGWDRMKSIKGAKVDDDWELVPESEVVQWLIKVLTWCLEKLSPFRAWYDIIREERKNGISGDW